MRVHAVPGRTAAGKVLDHAAHAAALESALAALQSADERRREVADLPGVFAERRPGPTPAGFGRHVRHWPQQGSQPDGEEFLANSRAEALRPAHIACRRDAELRRPHAEPVLLDARRRVEAERVSRIGTDGDRNSQAGALGQSLERVVPPGKEPGLGSRQDVEVPQMPLLNEPGCRRGIERVELLDEVAPASDRDGGVEKQASLLLKRHLPQEISDPDVDWGCGIFVRIHPAVAVQVPVTGSGRLARAAGRACDDRSGARRFHGLSIRARHASIHVESRRFYST